jgi:hypothetical protein
MTYKNWRVALVKGHAQPNPAAVIYRYSIFDGNADLFDQINALYNGEGEIEIVSKEYGYIFPVGDDPYSNFLRSELTALRIVDDMLKFNKPAMDESGIIQLHYAP